MAHSRPFHRLILFVLLLAAGFLISVAVAWGTELVAGIRGGVRIGADGAHVTRHPTQPSKLLHIDVRSSGGRRYWNAMWIPAPAGGSSVAYAKPLRSVPRYVKRPAPDEDIPYETTAYGYPFSCLKHYQTVSLPPHLIGKSRLFGGFNVGHDIFNWTFPLLPIYGGLIANTLFYAALLSLPFVHRSLRRHRRHHRGQCEFCGYDLRGDFSGPCPECGQRTA